MTTETDPKRQTSCSVPPAYRIPLRELVATMVQIDRMEEQMQKPPCVECGAETREQASRMCICGGDKDDCHGCRLWPDDGDDQ